ncbi:uncharacterized protein Fot_14359 [Forsythia ovata]|uniref:Uncharacterized protein n=1 Tax=Forsythia ovata TaxID=205694 RepID=A0ABD1W650_9LAMI
MQSGYEITGIQQQHNFMEENMNQNSEFNPQQQYHHVLQQIHTLPTTQQLFQGQNHFQAYFQQYHHQQRRLNESYCEPVQENISYVGSGGGGDCGSVPFFPASLKLDLNHESGRNNKETVIINEGEDALLRGSEQYDVPESRQTPLAMPHCWQNQEDSAIEQCFWKPLTAAVSNEDSEIEDKQEHQHMNSRNHSKYFQEPQMNCLERESRLYGELEAIYKRIGTAGSNQTGSGSVHLPVNTHIPASEASIGEEESMKMAKKRRKRKKMKDQLDSMSNFLESLVKQIMEHQENLHQKFTEVIERLDQERREREEAWRKQELAKFEREAEARAREKAMATSREAAIVSYLEKITGQRINLPALKLQPVISENPFCTELNSTSASDAGGDEHNERMA